VEVVCAEILRRLQAVELHISVRCVAEVAVLPPLLEPTELVRPHEEPTQRLLLRMGPPERRFQRAVAASMMLRFGWASGFAIGSYLVCDRVPLVDDYALEFSDDGLLRALWIRRVSFEPGERQSLLASLRNFSAPVVEAYHRWSGFSRHALWSMVISSWGAQFASIARQLGDAARGINEAAALFAGDPELARAAPKLYEVRVGESACTCQRRAACCLYFKSPGRPLCASCPILSESERLERNRQFVGGQRRLVGA